MVHAKEILMPLPISTYILSYSANKWGKNTKKLNKFQAGLNKFSKG